MSKFDYAEKIKHASHFEIGDIPSGADFAAFIAACQAGIQEHEHVPTGGAGTETGDAAPIYDLEDGADFHQQEAKNLVIHQGTSFPANPTEGQEFYRTDENRVYIYNGAEWKPASGDLTIPSGAICMFKSSCPDGWTRVSELDGKFPRGAASYGGSGGAASHNHPYCSGFYYNMRFALSTQSGAHAPRDMKGYGNTSWASNLPPYVVFVFCQKD